MSREVRMVPKTWEHPKEYSGKFIPLLDNYRDALNNFAEKIESKGLEEAIDYYGGIPIKENYMPEWRPEERTYLMMYETCSEGTPISPAFETPEKLAHWLADNKASAFGQMTATYEQWLITCKRGYTCGSAVYANGRFISSVEFDVEKEIK